MSTDFATLNNLFKVSHLSNYILFGDNANLFFANINITELVFFRANCKLDEISYLFNTKKLSLHYGKKCIIFHKNNQRYNLVLKPSNIYINESNQPFTVASGSYDQSWANIMEQNKKMLQQNIVQNANRNIFQNLF